MLDTGSSQSLISEELARRLKINFGLLDTGDSRVLFAANCGSIRVVGKCLLSVKLGGLTVPFQFLIIRQLSQDLVIGIDFLNHTRAVVNCSESIVSFYDDMVELPVLSKGKMIVAKLDSDYDLQPRSETVVNVFLSEYVSDEFFLLEPLDPRERQKFLVAKVLVKGKSNRAICRILNPTNQTFRLKKSLTLAKVQSIEVNSITQFSDTSNSRNNTQEPTIRNG